MMKMWQDELDSIVMEKQSYGGKVNRGVTRSEIETLKEKGPERLSVSFPEEYCEILTN